MEHRAAGKDRSSAIHGLRPPATDGKRPRERAGAIMKRLTICARVL